MEELVVVLKMVKDLQIQVEKALEDKRDLLQRNIILQQRVADLEMKLQQKDAQPHTCEDW